MNCIIFRNLRPLKEVGCYYSMKNDSSKPTSYAMSSGKEKARRKMPLKIVLRRLPAAMTWEQLETQLSPIPEFEFSEFVAAKSSEGISFSRVYFVFMKDDDAIAFKERFHGYVFVDDKGGESIGIVELAPNPKVPHDKLEDAKERDFKCGTIEADHEYKKFLSERENLQKPDPIPMEQLIKEIDEKEKMLEKNAVQETPLTQYMIRKSIRRIEEKRRAREEEKRERMERRNESELKDKQERQDIKKVIEFRNSRLERSNESSVKEKERTKIRTYRAGNCSYNGAIEKSGKWCDINDRDKCVQSSKKGRDTSAGSDPFSKKTKQNDENQCFKAEKVEELEREKTIKKDEGRTIFKKTISSNDTVEAISPDKLDTRVSRATSRILVHKTTAAEKDERNSDKGKKEEKTENGFTKPRRNKDRPERAIYQPSAARRRAAALAADGLSAMEKVASASKDKL
uniref:Smg4_UPF3 domain-containing protein n=2 Tax=Wuchereria bancrofti TaxID=6293 RepID=A0AAF5PKF6_WUCBA